MFSGYRSAGYFDEMFDRRTQPRTAQVDRHDANHGITFAHGGREQTFPFDLLPRVIDAADWQAIEAGLTQRVRAPDLFVADVYGPRHSVTRRKLCPCQTA